MYDHQTYTEQLKLITVFKTLVVLWCDRTWGNPKISRIFFWRGGTSVCFRLVHVCDCPPHQLAKWRPWGKVYRVCVIFFLSLSLFASIFWWQTQKNKVFASSFVSFWGKQQQKLSQYFERLLKKKLWARQGFMNGFLGSNVVTCHLKTNRDLGVLQQVEPTKTLKNLAMR